MLGQIFRFNRLDRKLSAQRERLYRMALAWCGEPALADDLVQDTLARALEKQAQLQDEARLDAWLYRILHNCWMEYLRTQRPALDLDAVELVCEDCPEQHASADQLIEQVHAVVAALPVSQRQVVTLVDLEGCSYEQVAMILDTPVGTVMSRLSRARAALKKHLLSSKNLEQVQYLRRVK